MTVDDTAGLDGFESLLGEFWNTFLERCHAAET